MEITQEKYEELLLAANAHKMLCRFITAKAENFGSLGNEELKMLRDVFCQEVHTGGGESQEPDCQASLRYFSQ